MKPFALIAAIVWYSSASAAETDYITTPHDRIPIYGTQADNPLADFDPETDDETVIVDGGELVLDHAETALDVLVRNGGYLTVAADLTFRNVSVITGGRLDVEDGVTLTFRDIPIDTTFDPSQYGNAILGHDSWVHFRGDDIREPTGYLQGELNAGEQTVLLTSIPPGWRVGDKLLFHDTRQPHDPSDISAQTETGVIDAINGNALHLATPLRFDHHGSRDGAGRILELPWVDCLTQPITIRNENDAGTRGHLIWLSHCDARGRGLRMVNIGRTTTDPLDNTKYDAGGKPTHIGTNQIARYDWHWHYCVGQHGLQNMTDEELASHGLSREDARWQGSITYCAIDGATKDCIDIHNTTFVDVSHNVCFNARGVGIMTENGWEYGFRISDNSIVAKDPGSGQRITARDGRNVAGGDHWHERVGLGLNSVVGEITGNRLACCKDAIGIAGVGTFSFSFPLVRGEHVDFSNGSLRGRKWWAWIPRFKDPPEPNAYPFLFDTSGNRCFACWRGIETWTANSVEQAVNGADYNPPVEFSGPLNLEMFPGFEIVHAHAPTDFNDQHGTSLHGWKIHGDWTDGPALNWKDNYRFGINVNDCDIRGYTTAYRLVGDDDHTDFLRCTFECRQIVDEPFGRLIPDFSHGWTGTWKDCTFLPVGGAVKFIDGEYPKYDLSLWLSANQPWRHSLQPIAYHIRPWLDGRDIDVFHYESHPEWVIRPYGGVEPGVAYGDWPAGVTSQRELIDLGTPVYGHIVPSWAFQDAEQFGPFWAAEPRSPLGPERRGRHVESKQE